MPFTNLYDVTFPPDTQLANLLGSDARASALNVQQRMAAISGLDASKPAFGSDSQPANWNGILFFATDTGQVYQFNNPVWTNVTASIAQARSYLWAYAGGIGFAVGPGLSLFWNPSGGTNGASENANQVPAGSAINVQSFAVSTIAAQPSTGSFFIVLRKNSVNTAISCTLAASAPLGVYQSTGGPVSFAATDLISIAVTNNAAVTSQVLNSLVLSY